MHFLIILIVLVNITAILFFSALYIKRIRLDNYRRATEKFSINYLTKPYLPL